MKIILTTLHSRYSHASLALPSLAACCAGIEGLEIILREYSVNERIEAILPQLAADGADVVAFSCYIWNIEQTLKLADDLKLVTPDTYIVIGGPEVSYGSHELLAGHPAIDCIVRGEGESVFRQLARLLADNTGCGISDEKLEGIDGLTFRSGDEIVTTRQQQPVRDLDSLPSPFSAGLIDTAKPLVYVETSRGCPFSCVFCLSSIDNGVRSYSAPRIEADLLALMQAGVKTIKLVDRTFNFDAKRANRIWKFILENNICSQFHFEIAADLLTDENVELLATVPAGLFRFEIGVQSTEAVTLESVGRSSDLTRLFFNISRLRKCPGVVLHLDLVAGLPGEDFSGFLSSLDRLLAARPDHIQIEPLKLLKGTAMRKIAREKDYAWSSAPPYRILRNHWLTFDDICHIQIISNRIENFYNSGRFSASTELLHRLGRLYSVLTGDAALEHSAGTNNMATLFASFHDLLQQNLPVELSHAITETLCFDYCMNGHPGNNLPTFFDRQPTPPPLSHPEIARLLSLSRENSFRTFTMEFSRDYTRSPWQKKTTVIIFVYLNRSAGERVRLLAVHQ